MTTPNLPAHLANRQSRGLAQSLTANLGVGSPPYLSIMGNRFTLIDSAGAEIPVATYDPRIGPYVDCVIIDVLKHTSKIYYDKPFDPSAQQYEPPACFSDNGIGPSANAAKPQARTCAECPNGMWGSKTSTVSGKGVKACSDIQKIAVLVPGQEMPFLLRLPPNSRTNLRAYTEKARAGGIDLDFVVTRISFEQGQLGTLKFEAVAFVDEAMTSLADKLLEAKATDAMIGRTDMPRVEALPAPAGAPQITQQPEPVATIQASGFAPQPLVPASQMPVNTVIQTGPLPQQTQPAPQPEPQRRRRRNTAEAAPQQAPMQPAAPAQAPFMPQQPTAAAPAAPSPAGNTFGIEQGAAPNADMQKALAGLFGNK